MKLQKLLSIIISISLALSCVSLGNVSVSASVVYTVSSDSIVKAVASQTVSIPVRISDNGGLMGYDMNFTYDEKVLSPISVTRGSIMTEGFFEDDIDGSTSTNISFRVFWSHAYPSTENGIIFYLNFNVDSKAMGSTTIQVGYDKSATFNGNYDDVPLNCSNISIAITNNEYDSNPVLSLSGNNISAGQLLNLDVFAQNIGTMKSVKVTVPYDSSNFKYSGMSMNGITAIATDSGSAVEVTISKFTNNADGKKLTLKFQSEDFATSGKYDFTATYSNLSGVDRILVKGTEVIVNATSFSDSIIIFPDNGIKTEYGEQKLIVPLYIKHNTGLMGYTLTFNYDSNILEAVSANAGSGFNGSFSTNIGKEAGKFTCLWFANDNVYSNGDFITLTFNVLAENESIGNITVSYNEKDIISEKTDGVKVSIPTINYKVNEVKLSSISVENPPTKTSYFIGESLNTARLKIKLNYNNGYSSYINSGFTTSGYDSTNAGTQTVTVTYQGKTATFNVTVKNKSLTGISVSKQPTKTSYFIGENLDTTGLQLKLSYDDGSTSYAVSGFTTSGFDSSKAGTQTVTVTYQGKTATFNVTVKNKSLTGIFVSKQPTKTSYFIGENLDTTGLQLKLSYDDGSTSYATSGFTTSGFDSSTVGNKTVTVTYQGKTATFNVTVKNKSLTGISVSKQPTKTSYFIGENLDTTGLQLKLSYDDGSTSYATSGFTTSGFDSSTVGNKTVTITYQGKTTTFNVTVKEKSLTGISVSKQPTKTSYFIGENLDTTGLQLKLSYDDGSTSYAVSGFTTSGFDSSKAGTQTVTATYQGKTATFNVTVKNKSLTGISVSKQPTKTSYFIGENLDTTGLQLKLSYDDGSTSYAKSGFTASGYDSSKAGTQKVTVTYQGKTATFNVTVKNKSLTGISVSKQPTKTSYFIGENLDTTGLQLNLSYDDGSTSYATSGFTTSGYDSTKNGTQTVTVTYQGKTATFNVTVKNKSLTGISVSKQPTKTSYFIGENLDTTGLQLKLSYDDGSTSYATSGFTASGFDSAKAGTQTVTATYQGKTATFNVTVKEKSLTGISVSKQPTKTNYFIGENLDITGLQLKLSYDDGSTSYATSGFTTSGYDSIKAGTQTVTVTYQGKTVTFNVTVKEKSLTGISVSKQPTKTSYFIGENLDTTGLQLKLSYDDGSTSYATNGFTTSGYDSSKAGTQTVTVTYLGKTATFNVTVIEKELTGILVSKLPTKTSYFIGEDLDTTGLQLKLSYDDGSASYATSGFTTSGYDSAKAGTQTVTVTYLGKTATFNVTVKEKELTGISVSKQPTKTSYFIGENLDTTGLQLKLSYDDGSTSYATSGFTTSGYDSAKAGAQTVTVTYQGKTATFNVTVKEKSLTGISVSKQPTKTSYFIGEDLDTTGLQLKLSYDDGSTSYAVSGFTTSGFDSSTVGNKTVTITYQEKTAEFEVTVEHEIIYLLGDVDGDGRITITDATTVQKYLAEYALPNTDVIEKCGDVDGDGRITITDATTIQKYLAEYPLPYNIGQPIS